jgi:coenzyme Q-binding protein COQ10
MPGASTSVVFNAPIEKCFEIISDYESYPDFLPEVKKLKVSNQKGTECDVQYEADLGIKVIKYKVHMTEVKPTKVSWTFIEGEFMKDNKGGWDLVADGAQTKATYNIDIVVGPLVPKSILDTMVKTQLPKLMENFKKRIESR